MLLAIDIGNSSIKFGVYDGENLESKFSVPTTAGTNLGELRKAVASNPIEKCTAAIVCSVVPKINPRIHELISEDLNLVPVFVKNDFDFGLRFDYEPLSAVGTDRLVNIFAAVEKFGAPVVVCSFGTALTIDVVNEDRVVPGGVIAPGLAMIADVLHEKTSQLPKIAIKKPPSVVQNTTIGSMQSGVVYGYVGLFEGLIAAIKKEIQVEPIVVATGGFAGIISQSSTVIDVVHETLLLDGLQILHNRIR